MNKYFHYKQKYLFDLFHLLITNQFATETSVFEQNTRGEGIEIE